MDALASDRSLGYAAAGLGYVVAGVHLFHPSHGVPRLVLVLSVDPTLLALDPRPLAFVISGLAVLAGVTAAIAGVPRHWLYAAGIALMATYLVGYFAWHASGHGGFLPGREAVAPHGHTFAELVVEHLQVDPWARVAVPAEVLLGVVLSVLLVRERGAGDA